MKKSPRFCVVGTGAMGCLCGGKPAQAGYDVTLLDIWPGHVGAIDEAGLVLDDAAGSTTVHVPASTDLAADGSVDMAIVFVDSNRTGEAGGIAASLLSPDGAALTLLIKGREKSRRQALHEPAIDYDALERQATAQAT